MGNCVVLGTQWGDEGKGKIIDLLTPAFDIVARYQGGHNAGHTVYVNGQKIILHLLPSGILHQGKLCVIGNGVVIHPKALLDEIAELKTYGVEVKDQLVISRNAHLILPYHSRVEAVMEEMSGDEKIGTTCRGIGPAYEDKASRYGIRVGDLLYPEHLRIKIIRNVDEKNIYLSHHGREKLEATEIYEEYLKYAEYLAPFIADVSFLLHQKQKQGASILFEGAQGALLDIDFGTYPFVTSSNSTVGGVLTGLGIGPDKIQAVLGVMKAYTTRVGGGPFPTESRDETGKYLMEKGSEYGATTGRPRRCGWFDAVAAAYSCRINGISKIVLTKSDVLDGLPELKICTGYRYKGELLPSFTTEPWILDEVKPEYRSFKGWEKPVSHGSDFSQLPQAYLDYISFIEDSIEAEVAVISTGVERKDTIVRSDRLETILDPSLLSHIWD